MSFTRRVASVDLQSTWCATCKKAARGTLARMQRIARKRGGVCLSDRYIAANVKLDFVCNDGHEFSMMPGAVINHWCPVCGVGVGRSRPTLTLEDMQATAEARGGKCLSPEYFGVRARYQWECARGTSLGGQRSSGARRSVVSCLCARDRGNHRRVPCTRSESRRRVFVDGVRRTADGSPVSVCPAASV